MADDSGYSTQSPSDKPSASTPITGLSEFDKNVDNTTISRFRHVHLLLEKPLLQYIRKTIRKKNCPISIRLMVLGRSENDAKPSIVVLCPEPQSKKVRKFFNKKSIRDLCLPEDGQPSFEVFVVGREPEMKQAFRTETCCGESEMEEAYTPAAYLGEHMEGLRGDLGISQASGDIRPSVFDACFDAFSDETYSEKPVTISEPETKQAAGDVDVLIPNGNYTNKTFCGTPIVIRQTSGVNKKCTFGGIIKAAWSNGEVKLYGLTVGHILLDDLEDDLTASTETDQSRCSDDWVFELSDSDSEDESSEEQDDEADSLCEIDELQLALTDAGSSWTAGELSKIGSISKDSPRYRSEGTDTKHHEPEIYYDWALIDMINYKPNLIRPRKMSHEDVQEDGVFNFGDHELVISASPSSGHGKRQPVVLISGSEGLKRGSLSALPSRLRLGPGKGFVDALILNLDNNKQILDGDSGSWVVNETTHEVYGYVVAADAFSGGYVIPLAEAFRNIADTLGCQSVDVATTVDMASDKPESTVEMDGEPTATIAPHFTKYSVRHSHEQPPNQRRPRERPPDPQVWEHHKTAIHYLYMEQNFTLASTMRLMHTEHQFRATEKMYKDKFKQWKWSKNLPKAIAARMLNIAHQRRPKRTVFWRNSRRWAIERIEKQSNRHSSEEISSIQKDSSIPDDFTYETPPSSGITDTESVLESLHSTDGDLEMADAATADTTEDLHKFLGEGLCRTNSTPEGLHSRVQEAVKAIEEGTRNHEEAESAFRDALSYYRHHCSPTHSKTLETGYLLASFYIKIGRVSDAHCIIDWMTKEHCGDTKSCNAKTVTHVLSTIVIFRQTRRDEEANLLTIRLLKHHRAPRADHFLLQNPSGPYVESYEMIEDLLASSEPEELATMSNILERLPTDSKNHQLLQDLLPRYIQKCDQLTLEKQAIQSRCILAEILAKNAQFQRAINILKEAEQLLDPFLKRNTDFQCPLELSTLKLARRLAFTFGEANDPDTCLTVLNTVLEHMDFDKDNDIGTGYGISVCNFLMSTASELHRKSSCEKSHAWMDQAFLKSRTLFGDNHECTKRIQEVMIACDMDIYFGDLSGTTMDALYRE